MKSQIPWNNHIMRKFGGSIRDKLAEIGIRQNIDIKFYQARSILERPTWIATKPGRC